MSKDALINNKVYLLKTLERIAILIFDLKSIAFREERNLSKLGKNTLMWQLIVSKWVLKKFNTVMINANISSPE